MIHKIKNHFTGLRERPDHERRRWAIFYAGLITFGVFILWAYNFAVMLTETNTVATDKTEIKEADSPFANMREAVTDQMARVKDGWEVTRQRFEGLKPATTLEGIDQPQ